MKVIVKDMRSMQIPPNLTPVHQISIENLIGTSCVFKIHSLLRENNLE